MITSLRNILENKHTLIEETSYCAEQKELFDYPIVSGDFYEITGDNPGEKEIRFKNTVDVSVFQRIDQIQIKITDPPGYFSEIF